MMNKCPLQSDVKNLSCYQKSYLFDHFLKNTSKKIV